MVGNASLREACSHLTGSERREGYRRVRACHSNRLYSGYSLLSFHACISTRLHVYVTSQSEYSVCVSCSESTSQETWQFTYHIQTAFVLNICHFHSLVARSPLSSLAVSLFSILPEALALNQPSFYCFFFNMLAFEKWTLSLTHKKITAFIFS